LNIERGRVRGWGYGHDAGALPYRTYATLIVGLLLGITGCKQDEVDTGVALHELGQFGAGGRAMYDPCLGVPARFDWTGDNP
jgi:hypothetical protein